MITEIFFNEVKKEDDITIYKVADSAELCEIYSQNFPAVIVSNKVKEFAKFLARNREFVKKTSSRTILICSDKVPKKYITALFRYGLTEHLGDDVNPKTLFYKTNLLLKALPDLNDKEKDVIVVNVGLPERTDEGFMRVGGGTSKVNTNAALGSVSQGGDNIIKTKEATKISRAIDVVNNPVAAAPEPPRAVINTTNDSGEEVESDVIHEFIDEAKTICQEMEMVLGIFEEDVSQKVSLEEFIQLAGRISGGAKGVGLNSVSLYCDLGQNIANKANKVNIDAILDVVAAVLFDFVAYLDKMIEDIKIGSEESIKNLKDQGFVTRLKWLLGKFSELGVEEEVDSSQPVENKQMDQASVDAMLDGLGL